MRRDLYTQSIGLPLHRDMLAGLRAGFQSLMVEDYRLLDRLDRDHPHRGRVMARIARLKLDIADLEQDA